ncbi:MAG: hypothetical protein AAF551_15120 [Bacteroidota bacterium]
MDKLKFPISLTSSVLLLYIVSAAFDMPYALVFWLFVLINGLFIWMVLKILKDGKPSTKQFDEVFYEDYDYKRSS